MPDFALFVPDHGYNSSAGVFLDSVVLVRDQMQRLYTAEERLPLEARLQVLTATGEPAQLVGGRSLVADGSIAGGADFELVHVCSFKVGGYAPFEQRLAAAGPVLAWLRRQHERGALVSASGSAVLLMMASGLTANLPVPVPRPLVPLARDHFPRGIIDEDRAVIEHDRLLMSNGFAGDPALMGRLIELRMAPELGRWLSSVLGVDRLEHERLSGDPLVANAQIWIEQRFTHPVRIAELAGHLSASHQTLIRRFVRELGVPPNAYVQQLRVSAAERMLRRSDRSVDSIAAMVGYRDIRAFRAIFRKKTGYSPTAYRAAVRAGTA